MQAHPGKKSHPLRRGWRALIAGTLLLVPLAGPAQAAEHPVVVATFSLVADWVAAVGGDRIDLRTLAPVGAEVHEWELSARNFVDVDGAALLFYNGLGLEQWMHQIEGVVGSDVPLVALAEDSGYPTLPITTGDFAGRPDPHLWMDPRAVSTYVDVIEARLADLLPEHADTFAANADAYRRELAGLDTDLRAELAAIPHDQRTLISSEAAFIYFANAYDFHHDGIWGTNAEDEGTPRQMARIIDILRERRPAAIFWESTISDRHVRAVAEDVNIAIAGPLYVDSLGEAGSGADTYTAMMRRNADVLVRALAGGP